MSDASALLPLIRHGHPLADALASGATEWRDEKGLSLLSLAAIALWENPSLPVDALHDLFGLRPWPAHAVEEAAVVWLAISPSCQASPAQTGLLFRCTNAASRDIKGLSSALDRLVGYSGATPKTLGMLLTAGTRFADKSLEATIWRHAVPLLQEDAGKSHPLFLSEKTVTALRRPNLPAIPASAPYLLALLCIYPTIYRADDEDGDDYDGEDGEEFEEGDEPLRFYFSPDDPIRLRSRELILSNFDKIAPLLTGQLTVFLDKQWAAMEDEPGVQAFLRRASMQSLAERPAPSRARL